MKKANISENGASLICVWPDGHESVYPIDFLFATRMPEKRKESKGNLDYLVKNELLLWKRERCK